MGGRGGTGRGVMLPLPFLACFFKALSPFNNSSTIFKSFWSHSSSSLFLLISCSSSPLPTSRPRAAFPLFLSLCLLASSVRTCCCLCTAAQLALQTLLVIVWILVSPGEKGCDVLQVRLNPDLINQAPFFFLLEINLFCCSLQEN